MELSMQDIEALALDAVGSFNAEGSTAEHDVNRWAQEFAGDMLAEATLHFGAGEPTPGERRSIAAAYVAYIEAHATLGGEDDEREAAARLIGLLMKFAEVSAR